MAEEKFLSYGNTNISSLLASTWSASEKEVTDSIYGGMVALKYLTANGRLKKYSDGASILIPIMYAKSTNAKFQSPTDVVDTVIQDPFTSVQYKWKYLTCPVIVSDYLVDANAGKSRIFDVVEGLKNNTILATQDKLAVALFATSPASTEPNSLATIIDSTGTIGDQAVNATYWASTETTSGSFAAQGPKDMTTIYNTVSKDGTDTPDLAVTTQTVYEYYENLARLYGRFDLLGKKAAIDLGIETLKFKGADMVWSSNCNSGTMYFINTKYLKIGVMAHNNFSLGEFRAPANQMVKISICLWQGEIIASSRIRHGKLVSISA